MDNTQKPTAKAEATRKGIRKVNLSDLQGQLHQRGRERYHDPELAEALAEMMNDLQPFIWEKAEVTGKDDKARNASKAKWRNRAISVMASVDDTFEVSVRWTTSDEMLILPKGE